MQPGVVSLVVISDVVCPWCYIGQRELQKAIQDVSDCSLKIKVEHRPFLLQPSMSEDLAIEKQKWYEEKFGKDKYEQIQSMVSSRAKEVGIEINFEGWVCQTIRAHRLSRKAFELGGQELQEKFLEAIFYAYFTKGRNISDFDTLAELAEEVGVLSKDQAVEFLKSPELQEEVEQMAVDARKKGVTGVPFTIINGRWAVSGGQSAEVYAQIFRKLAGKGPLHAIPNAPSCGDGTCPTAAAAAAVKS
ncbi:thioredoxin-like protein [Earliella scabrosa]|nr:thioredoxin-like protein [Earliella scabrosa]